MIYRKKYESQEEFHFKKAKTAKTKEDVYYHLPLPIFQAILTIQNFFFDDYSP